MLRALPAVLAAAVLTGCAQDAGGSDGDRLQVAVALYPYEFVLERVGGGDVEPVSLVPPGAEPHDLELTPRQVGQVADADLVVYSAGFQPALDEAVEQQAEGAALDVLGLVEVREAGEAGDEEEHGEEGHDHAGEDPHVWLDPARLAQVADGVAERLGALRPERAAAFSARAADLREELEALDGEYRAGLATCERRAVVTSHDSFGYLTERYGLEQIAVSGLSPEEEPSARRLADVAEAARTAGVTTVFFEELVSPRVAEQLAREVGATAEVLSPLESAPDDGDYLTAMRANLAALRTSLGCA